MYYIKQSLCVCMYSSLRNVCCHLLFKGSAHYVNFLESLFRNVTLDRELSFTQACRSFLHIVVNLIAISPDLLVQFTILPCI